MTINNPKFYTFATDGYTFCITVMISKEHGGGAFAIALNPANASRLVVELARDLYEAGHITPGEITDHMLRGTATRTEEEGED